jgi:hypothetical protein
MAQDDVMPLFVQQCDNQSTCNYFQTRTLGTVSRRRRSGVADRMIASHALKLPIDSKHWLPGMMQTLLEQEAGMLSDASSHACHFAMAQHVQSLAGCLLP